MWKTPGFVYNLSENSLFYGLFSTSTLVHPRLPGNFHRLKKCVTILIYFGWGYLPARGLKLAMKKKTLPVGHPLSDAVCNLELCGWRAVPWQR